MFSEILIFHPFFSILISIGIVLGISQIGDFFLQFFNLDFLSSRAHHPIIGTILTAQIIFVFVVFGIQDKLVYISVFLIILGLFYIRNLRIINYKDSIKVEYPFSFLILIGYFLFSLSPLTNADSIDYHIGVPLHILRFESFPNDGGWLSARLFGFGEFTNLLGISAKTINLGSIIQFLSIVSIYESIKINIKSKSKPFNSAIRLSIVSLPILIFLVGTSKFQLFPIALIILSLNIYINYWKESSPKRIVFLILFLCMSATLFKFNYLLSAFLISLIVLVRVFLQNRNNFFACIFISFFMFLIIMIPFYAYKSYLFEASIIDAFLSPTIGDFIGYKNYLSMLQNYNESQFTFPISLLFPDSLGNVTSVIGIGFLLAIFLNKFTLRKNLMMIIYLALLLIMLLMFAQYTARTFLDFYFAFLMLVARTIDPNKFIVSLYKYLIYAQSMLLISLLSFGIYNSIGGTFSISARTDVMNNQSNGFAIANWIDELVPSESSIIVTNRSMSFSKNSMIAGDWIEYVDWSTEEPIYYLDKIIDSDQVFIFYIKNVDGNFNIPSALLKCIDRNGIISSKDFKLAVRNPFNKAYQKVFLGQFNAKNTIKCLEK